MIASKPVRWFHCVLLVIAGLGFSLAQAEPLTLHTRSRTESVKGSTEWQTKESTVQWEPNQTAIVICDMWNQHWCKGATERVAEMAPRMNEVIKEARRRGVFIIHCPSDTMKHYEGTPQRKLAQAAPVAPSRVPLQSWVGLDAQREGALPIDDSDGGCDDEPPCKHGAPWSREIETLKIEAGDAITDSAEAYNLMQQRGIKNVIVMGVHGNMCVLGRPFAIRQMVRQGKNVVLMRDMIDTMYNSRQAPYVSHFVGTDLLVEHVEKFWCPSITSVDFLGGEPFHFQADRRPKVVFVIGENEYHTWETLPEFSRQELDWRGLKCSFVTASTNIKDNAFTNYSVIKDADLLVLSARRRTPPREMMDLIHAHLDAHKPLVGIRTASHAFAAIPPDNHYASWSNLDVEILGANYQNHYGNVGPNDFSTLVQVIPKDHPILTGLPTNELAVQGSLYKIRDPSPGVTVLMTGRLKSGSDIEPVAWVNTASQRRVFYTSLGAPGNFKQPFFRELLLNGIFWALDLRVPPKLVPKPGMAALAAAPVKSSGAPPKSGPAKKAQDQPRSPVESLADFKIADDLEIEQVLTEPRVRQPVFMNFDERGRLWVVEYLQYPSPAGLKVLSHDNVWRVIYDKVPPPPPHHFVGADKITIYEDTQGNGVFDKQKTFIEGLNIVTAVTKGRGGVWVLNPPYLLFYPDKNNDDVPDGDPQVILSGFGLEDTHSVVNSLRWGPDGWLYACQGSTVTASVSRPGIDREPIARTMGQQIWRYHPETKRFEVFSEGGGNAFGCEIDAQGRIFSGHNGGNTRGFHYMQGAYLQKGFEKHGELSNPYAFGYFPPMPHPAVDRFTHNFVIYDGGALPAHYAGKLLGLEPLQGRVVESDIEPDSSSFKTVDLGYPVTTSDQWFRPVDIKVGPDGAIYLADWYDAQVTHLVSYNRPVDKDHGRIYRLKAKGAKPLKPFDLGKFSSTELVNVLSHSNKWFRQEALRLIGDRKDKTIVPQLKKMVDENAGQLALESLWALNLSGGFDDEVALRALEHANPFVRLWTARLLGDAQKVSPAIARKLAAVAVAEPNVEVRAQLACSARRLPAADSFPIVKNLLARDEDATEKRLPLLLWWAIEAKCETDPQAVMKLFGDPAIWRLPLVRQYILERIMQRYALAGRRQDLLACAQLFQLSPGAAQTAKLMSGFELAFKGRSTAALPTELLEAVVRAGAKSMVLELRRREASAVDQALREIGNYSTGFEKRREYIEILGEVKEPRVLPILLTLMADPKEAALHQTILKTLQSFEDSRIGTSVIERYKSFDGAAQPAALELLSSRTVWARQLLEVVDVGKIAKSAIPQDVLHKLKSYQDAEIAGQVKKHWGGERVVTTVEMQERIKRYAALVRDGSGDPYAGRTLFTANCGMCHKLFELGGQIGPDLTPYKRDDLDTMLRNIVNPSAEIREGYENYLVTTRDGRTLSGFLADKDNQVVVLRGLDGLNQVLPQNQIAEMKSTGVSLMPEGLLESFDDQKVRDLFAYLRISQPLIGSPPRPSAKK